jgi:hypothetical protein
MYVARYSLHLPSCRSPPPDAGRARSRERSPARGGSYASRDRDSRRDDRDSRRDDRDAKRDDRDTRRDDRYRDSRRDEDYDRDRRERERDSRRDDNDRGREDRDRR